MRLLLLLFIALPFIELYLLVQVSGAIGFLPTVALVLGIGALGLFVLRRQSFNTFRRARSRLQGGELPGRELIEGFFIAAGGILLLTPGFITDIFAILLLFPPTRRALAQYLLQGGRIATFTRPGGFTFMHMGPTRPPQPGSGHDIYEGEFTREREGARSLPQAESPTADKPGKSDTRE